jgi:predicted Zn finger-like uncharacterized protein
MITCCTGCQTRYRLDDSKVPPRLVRVRCPRCRAVFMLDGTQAAAQVEKPEQSLVLERAGDNFRFPQQQAAAGIPKPEAIKPDPAAEPQPEKRAAGAAVAVEEEDKPKRRSRDKARMLARALVSDILVYNQELRDKALAEGTLLEALGPEIKKSWELYKDKVTPTVANSTTHFRDALNEILAGGQKLF